MTGCLARRFVDLFCTTGPRTSARLEMQGPPLVAAAWRSPIRGAIVGAARQGLTLASKPDLITVAARAARERLLLVRNAGLRLSAVGTSLLLLPECWAIACVREIAKRLDEVGDLPCIPTCEEALRVRDRLEILERGQGPVTPAADFLDGFTREESGRPSQEGAWAERGSSEVRQVGSC